MFISNLEKSNIDRRLASLEARVEQLVRSLNALHDAKTMASDPAGLKLRPALLREAPKAEKPKTRNNRWTPKKRAAQSERIKKAWADKKAKAAQAKAEAANNSTTAN